jgi:hypothetical protein
MKKLLFLSILFLYTQTNVSAQIWKYENGGSAFDGKYKTSFIKGLGSEFPYNKPILAINKFDKNSSINFYISSAGYFQEDTGVKILWVFNTEPNVIYSTYDWSYSSDGKIIFFKEFNDPNSDNKISRYEFIEKLKLASKVSVRISNKYGSNDLTFSLSGSTKAIDFVLPNLKDLISDVVYKRQIKNKFKEEKKIELNKLLEILKTQKISESSMSILKNKIKTDLGIGLLGQKGTGESYTSLKVYPFKEKGMFESFRYVNVFYVLEDGTEKEIYGSYKVGKDSPLFKKFEEEKLLREKQQKEEKLLREKQQKIRNENIKRENEILNKLLVKYKLDALKKEIFGAVMSEQYLLTNSTESWEVNQIQKVSVIISNFKFKKYWSMDVIIRLNDNKKIIRNVMIAHLKLTKKQLKSIGGKVSVEF